jgi:hypothetical protein
MSDSFQKFISILGRRQHKEKVLSIYCVAFKVKYAKIVENLPILIAKRDQGPML